MIYSLISVKNTINNQQVSRKNVSFKAAPIPKSIIDNIDSIAWKKGVKTADIYLHASPDEDTAQAGKVMYNKCKSMGIIPALCVSKEKLRGLFLGHGRYKIKSNVEPADVTWVLDFSSNTKMSRLFKDVFAKADSENIVNLDHHQEVLGDSLKGYVYRDNKAYSCCAMLYRYFEGKGEKLDKNDLKSLYCGILSDFEKSKLIKFEDAKLKRLPLLDEDPDSKEVLTKIESQLTDKAKMQVYKHLDVLSNLSPKEKAFRQRLFSQVQVTPNGKLAYIVIDPEDKEWISLGMKNARTSPILRELRLKLINGVMEDASFTPEQRQGFKNLQGAAVFYRAGGVYQMSLTTKNNYANDLMDYIKKNINPNLVGGGHENRQGARIFSIDKNDVDPFVQTFLTASQKLG